MTPEEIELLSELTIVIPTYNRPFELERSIEYWRDTPVTVHILDGSIRQCLPSGILAEAQNVTYHHVPPYENESAIQCYFRRLEMSVLFSKTKYKALCAEDDFFSVAGVVACLKELEEDDSVQIARGLTLWFDVSSGVFTFRLKHLGLLQQIQASHDDFGKRIVGQDGTYYSIFRTDTFNMRQKLCPADKLGDHRFHEVLFTYLGNALSKVSTLNEVVWLRQSVKPGAQKGIPAPKSVPVKVARRALEVFKTQLLIAARRSNQFESYQSIRIGVRYLVKSNWKSYGKVGLSGKYFESIYLGIVNVTSNKIPIRVKILVNSLFRRAFFPALFTVDGQASHSLTKRQSLDDLSKVLDSNGIQYSAREIEKLKVLLLMPREELRLRADI